MTLTIPYILLESSSITPHPISSPKPHSLPCLSHPPSNPIDSCFHQSLCHSSCPSGSPLTQTSTANSYTSSSTHSAVTGSIFASHTWQDQFSSTQTYEEREWDQPNADTEIRGDLGESWYIGVWIISRAPRRTRRRSREVAEPEEVVDENKDCIGRASADSRRASS